MLEHPLESKILVKSRFSHQFNVLVIDRDINSKYQVESYLIKIYIQICFLKSVLIKP